MAALWPLLFCGKGVPNLLIISLDLRLYNRIVVGNYDNVPWMSQCNMWASRSNPEPKSSSGIDASVLADGTRFEGI